MSDFTVKARGDIKRGSLVQIGIINASVAKLSEPLLGAYIAIAGRDIADSEQVIYNDKKNTDDLLVYGTVIDGRIFGREISDEALNLQDQYNTICRALLI